jgi:hypothetical protein
MVSQEMIDTATFKSLSDCLALHFVHAVHRGFRRLCMMCIIPQRNINITLNHTINLNITNNKINANAGIDMSIGW